MKKIKDFFYDKNDIIIVLIIVAIAAFIIYTCIDSIMGYPKQYIEEVQATATEKVVETTAPTEAAEPSETTESSTDSSSEEE